MKGLLLIQKAIRARLVASPDVTAFVPPENIQDYRGLPTVFPCIVMGDDQAVDDKNVVGHPEDTPWYQAQIYSNLHVWSREGGMYRCKEIAAAVQDALFLRLDIGTSKNAVQFQQVRFIRDPDGETSHGILTFRTRWWEARE